jgi:hypothetical protein
MAYTLFNLDGFHNRTLDDWREVRHRTHHEARLVPGRFDGHRYVREHVSPAFDVIECWSWRVCARRHALQHGAAGVWHCDDSFTLFYRDGGKVRTKRFPHARPTKATAA